SGGSTYGVCLPRAKRGQTCAYDFYRDRASDVCTLGTICHSAFDPPRCEPPSGAGERCRVASDCAVGEEGGGPICDVGRPPEPRLGVCADAGIVPEGSACLEDRACAGGLGCRPGADGTPICRGPGTDGDRCGDADDDCATGLYCAPEYPRVCRPVLGAGDTCAPSQACAEGLVCREDDGRCGPPSAEGGACGGSHDCAAGLACAGGACALRAGPGEACDASDWCAPGLRCIDRACAPQGREGDRCEERLDCIFGNRCKFGTCRPLHPWSPEGGACESSADCLGGRPCDGGVCQPRSGEGGSCSNDHDCSEELYCGGWVCRRRLPTGSACVAEHACQGFACDFSTDPPTCAD
ncbi:MAG TPA: Dickkopf N-terminal cysteine-rich domain-containing protein, partial [Vulgatibacter sp.]